MSGQPLVIKEFPSLSKGPDNQWKFRLIKRKLPSGIRLCLDIREYEVRDRSVGFTQKGVYFTSEEIPFVIMTLQKALQEIRDGSDVRSGSKDFSNHPNQAKLV